MKKLPIGISDFKSVIENDYYYVDKTLFIQELLATSGTVALIPRPRRFGKTLNLSMLQYFFENTKIKHDYLFHKTKIWQEPERSYQGQYPVIFLTFKDIKADNWPEAYKHLTMLITKEFDRLAVKLQSGLTTYQTKLYKAIVEQTADKVEYSTSLQLLSEILYNHYQKKVIFLLDEYDNPIHAAYLHGYYNEMVTFVRPLLTSILKDNVFLERGIITGILRTAKEGIFSGLNNLDVASFLSPKYADKFGFSDQEVKELLIDQNMTQEQETIKAWYNGYHCGTTLLYNPWSIINCADKKGLLKIYWVNTSDNALIKKIIALADTDVKIALELLLRNESLYEKIDEGLIFPGFEHNAKAVWGLLLFTGYLTYSSHEIKDGKDYCGLIIPNQEIRILFYELIQAIFEKPLEAVKVQQLRQIMSAAMASFRPVQKSQKLFYFNIIYIIRDGWYTLTKEIFLHQSHNDINY